MEYTISTTNNIATLVKRGVVQRKYLEQALELENKHKPEIIKLNETMKERRKLVRVRPEEMENNILKSLIRASIVNLTRSCDDINQRIR